MKNKNTLLAIAGIISLFIFFLHLIGGQITLVNPMMNSPLEDQVKTELLGAWHMITLLLLFSSYVLLHFAFSKTKKYSKELISFIGTLNLLFALAFIGVSMFNKVFAPQWILFLPIWLLCLYSVKKEEIIR